MHRLGHEIDRSVGRFATRLLTGKEDLLFFACPYADPDLLADWYYEDLRHSKERY